MKNFFTVLKTLGVALLGGALTGVADSVVTGKIDLNHVKGAALAGALTTAGAFLVQSPRAVAAPAPPAQLAAQLAAEPKE